MKTKTLVTTVAMAGALLASASVAKANAFLELVSGSVTATYSTAGNNIAENNLSVGGWSVSIVSGSSFGSFNVDESTTGSGTPAHGLSVYYSSGGYSFDGNYDFSGSESGDNVPAQVQLWLASGSTIWSGSGSKGVNEGVLDLPTVAQTDFAPVPVPFRSKSGDNSFLGEPDLVGSVGGTYVVTEAIYIDGGSAATTAPLPANGISAEVQNNFNVTPNVPDGGMTLTMVGSVLVGLAGLRSKFGAKRS